MAILALRGVFQFRCPISEHCGIVRLFQGILQKKKPWTQKGEDAGIKFSSEQQKADIYAYRSGEA